MSGAQNPVDIDPAALAHEADSVNVPQGDAPPAADAPAAGGAEAVSEPGIAGELSPQEAEQRAATMAPMLRQFIMSTARTLVPAWNITHDECAALAQSYALVMVYWWPDMQLPPKWAALAGAALATYAVVDSRRDTEGKLLPRAVVSAGRGSASAPAAAESGARTSAEAHTTGSGGGFKTSA